MVFSDSGDDEESDYAPSEGGDSEEDGDEELSVSSREEPQEETIENEEDIDDDTRWWKSGEDKRRWEKQFRRADAAFRSRFGLSIDTPAHPETRKKLKLKTTSSKISTFVLTSVVVLSLVQLAMVYSASSWAFSIVAWRSTNFEKDSDDDALVGFTSYGFDEKISTPLSRLQVPDHVRTGLYLCSTLTRRVVTTERNVTVTQHALRVCDIAVTFAPLHSCEAIEAHVLRGDLRSLLLLFDSAEEDYRAAMKLVHEAESGTWKLMLNFELSQHLDLKLAANHWTRLYTDKSFKELRREAKARAALTMNQSELGNEANAVTKLAVDWISAFKREKDVVVVLTRQRSWTLRHLKYQVSNDDDSG